METSQDVSGNHHDVYTRLDDAFPANVAMLSHKTRKLLSELCSSHARQSIDSILEACCTM